MVDTTQKPYYCYNDAIDLLLKPIQSLADVRLLGFGRVFPNRERFMICYEKEWSIDFYNRKLYRYGLYEKPIHELVSAFNMWDHLPYSPPEIYIHTRKTFDIAHGLTIVQQHGDYCDNFVFASRPGNNQINNFYLNQKDLFTEFTKVFYETMVKEIVDLENHKIIMPNMINLNPNPISILSPRQRECALLLAAGDQTKEIARKLVVSPRTVEYHLDALREKFQVNNRIQLVYSLKNLL